MNRASAPGTRASTASAPPASSSRSISETSRRAGADATATTSPANAPGAPAATRARPPAGRRRRRRTSPRPLRAFRRRPGPARSSSRPRPGPRAPRLRARSPVRGATAAPPRTGPGTKKEAPTRRAPPPPGTSPCDNARAFSFSFSNSSSSASFRPRRLSCPPAGASRARGSPPRGPRRSRVRFPPKPRRLSRRSRAPKPRRAPRLASANAPNGRPRRRGRRGVRARTPGKSFGRFFRTCQFRFGSGSSRGAGSETRLRRSVHTRCLSGGSRGGIRLRRKRRVSLVARTISMSCSTRPASSFSSSACSFLSARQALRRRLPVRRRVRRRACGAVSDRTRDISQTKFATGRSPGVPRVESSRVRGGAISRRRSRRRRARRREASV